MLFGESTGCVQLSRGVGCPPARATHALRTRTSFSYAKEIIEQGTTNPRALHHHESLPRSNKRRAELGRKRLRERLANYNEQPYVCQAIVSIGGLVRLPGNA